ncbi:MAG: shikimate kinase [Melioribacteraceae bacterium]|nr:MAG: shikimate kinase [Melioribacteraceae bacterium]
MIEHKLIYLTGFMTSGKSTIGPILANVLGWNFYDLDKVIEEKENKSVVEIFDINGEAYFRDVENKTLKELSEQANTVIALGGGTLTNDENLDIIKNSGILVYLKVSPEVLYKRLRNKIDRPLFKDLVLGEKSEEEFVQKIEDLLERRENYYNKADLIINTDETRIGYTVDKIAKQILSLLNGKN